MYIFIINYNNTFENIIYSESKITLDQFYSCNKNIVYSCMVHKICTMIKDVNNNNK